MYREYHGVGTLVDWGQRNVDALVVNMCNTIGRGCGGHGDGGLLDVRLNHKPHFCGALHACTAVLKDGDRA